MLQAWPVCHCCSNDAVIWVPHYILIQYLFLHHLESKAQLRGREELLS